MDSLVWMGILLAELAGWSGTVPPQPRAEAPKTEMAAAPPPAAIPRRIECEAPLLALSFAPQVTCDLAPCEPVCVREAATVEMEKPCRLDHCASAEPVASQLSAAGRGTLWKLMNYGQDSADRVFLPAPDPSLSYRSPGPAARADLMPPPASANPFFVVLFRPGAPDEGDVDPATLLERTLHQSRLPGRDGRAAGKNYTLLQRDHRQMGKTYARAE